MIFSNERSFSLRFRTSEGRGSPRPAARRARRQQRTLRKICQICARGSSAWVVVTDAVAATVLAAYFAAPEPRSLIGDMQCNMQLHHVAIMRADAREVEVDFILLSSWQVPFPKGSPRAFRAWPLAWPLPSGPLGRQRSLGSTARRRRVRAQRGCEAPLRPEGPTRTMRGVRARWL